MALVRDLFGLRSRTARRAGRGAASEPARCATRRGARLRQRSADPGRDAWERARARAGGLGRGSRSGVDSRARRDHDAGDAGPRSATSRAGCPSSSGRCSADEIDLAVHSAKDVPAELADGLELGGDSGARGSARRDLRCAVAGGAGARRAGRDEQPPPGGADPRRCVPTSRSCELRGNVDTRLRKLADGEVDALVLALAGLARLGRTDAADGVLDELVPAAGQGALALEARRRDDRRGDARSADRSAATACVRGRTRAHARLGRVVQHRRRCLRAGSPADGELELAALGRSPRRFGVDRRPAHAGRRAGRWLVAERMLAAGARAAAQRARAEADWRDRVPGGRGSGRPGADDRARRSS